MSYDEMEEYSGEERDADEAKVIGAMCYLWK